MYWLLVGGLVVGSAIGLVVLRRRTKDDGLEYEPAGPKIDLAVITADRIDANAITTGNYCDRFGCQEKARWTFFFEDEPDKEMHFCHEHIWQVIFDAIKMYGESMIRLGPIEESKLSDDPLIWESRLGPMLRTTHIPSGKPELTEEQMQEILARVRKEFESGGFNG